MAAGYHRVGEGGRAATGRVRPAGVGARHPARGLARDRLGARRSSLLAGGRLCFASEIEIYFAAGPPPGSRSSRSCELAGGGQRPGGGGRTLYEGVTALLPGHYLRLDDGRWEPRRYWGPRYSGTTELARDGSPRAPARDRGGGSRSESGAGRAGILLSGGLDSASVAGVAAADSAATAWAGFGAQRVLGAVPAAIRRPTSRS